MTTEFKDNPLHKLQALGQSIWLDYIRRDLISSGELRTLIHNDGLSGITSNPAIFEIALAQSNLYDQDIINMAGKNKDAKAIYESLSQRDVQNAADELRPVYETTKGHDGYVSLEVDPRLANDTSGTIAEARRLWKSLDRPNVMIKVPATSAGIPVIKQMISEGININVTLIFGLSCYWQTAKAFIAGLEIRDKKGGELQNVASVASFFLSRIDTMVDPLIENFLTPDSGKVEIARSTHGKVAVASAKIAYQIYKEIFSSKQFERLADKGVSPQRLLWASTAVKNSDFSEIKYVELLIGPDTVSTLPPETLAAYRNHGSPELTLEQNIEDARSVMQQLIRLDISIDKVASDLENQGIKKFIEPFEKLLNAITQKSNKER